MNGSMYYETVLFNVFFLIMMGHSDPILITEDRICHLSP